ncbi:acyl-CoA dehydrogenase family protein [Amycolatopsis sp. cg5]|uniref:acyl-CoA dehydrogenase family protein n=1 Tax=Amycolatopsis sp. cg5 TaxID=3238802 RepID=UPI0035252DA8
MDFTPDATQAEITRLAATVLRRDPERPWQALAESGLLALALPAELDGDGLGLAEVALVLTEVGRAAAQAPALAALALGVLPIDRLGSPRQRADLLPAIASGAAVVTAALHEPSAPMTTRPSATAVPSDGAWSLSGTKTAVPYAETATAMLVPVTMAGGTAVFVVHPRASGVTLVPTRNASESPECTVVLTDVRVTEDDLLADGALAALHRFALAGAVALGDGLLAGALELTTSHVGTREQFGKPLARFQAVAQQIADVYIASRTVHLAALSAIWRLSEGLDADTDLEVAAYWLAEEAPKALAACQHLHGGLGVDVTYPLHRYYSGIKDLSRFVGGASHRLDRIGELV